MLNGDSCGISWDITSPRDTTLMNSLSGTEEVELEISHRVRHIGGIPSHVQQGPPQDHVSFDHVQIRKSDRVSASIGIHVEPTNSEEYARASSGSFFAASPSGAVQ